MDQNGSGTITVAVTADQQLVQQAPGLAGDLRLDDLTPRRVDHRRTGRHTRRWAVDRAAAHLRHARAGDGIGGVAERTRTARSEAVLFTRDRPQDVDRVPHRRSRSCRRPDRVRRPRTARRSGRDAVRRRHRGGRPDARRSVRADVHGHPAGTGRRDDRRRRPVAAVVDDPVRRHRRRPDHRDDDIVGDRTQLDLAGHAVVRGAGIVGAAVDRLHRDHRPPPAPHRSADARWPRWSTSKSATSSCSDRPRPFCSTPWSSTTTHGAEPATFCST